MIGYDYMRWRLPHGFEEEWKRNPQLRKLWYEYMSKNLECRDMYEARMLWVEKGTKMPPDRPKMTSEEARLAKNERNRRYYAKVMADPEKHARRKEVAAASRRRRGIPVKEPAPDPVERAKRRRVRENAWRKKRREALRATEAKRLQEVS